jgi:hypothetical protein
MLDTGLIRTEISANSGVRTREPGLPFTRGAMRM